MVYYEMDSRSRHFWALLPSLEAIRRRRYDAVMRQRRIQQQMQAYPVVDSIVRNIYRSSDYPGDYLDHSSSTYTDMDLYRNLSWRSMTNRYFGRRSLMIDLRRHGQFPYPGNVRMAGNQFDSRREYGDDEWPLRRSVQRVNDDWVTMIMNGDIDPGDRGDWHDNDILD